ncbi:hypothetical protein BT63DRAFT_235731 [Microthyrium microscopicum]|uniref:DSC E3 ubiquitin ligase complex subunit A n=1 Tax=Microthyrium microscopicum TaxID=703497 RepID=A0A6A6UFW5_9PEZI|nr:hypothetical protein BT63DRAFT_235731 [Microthyrium microscopicum]
MSLWGRRVVSVVVILLLLSLFDSSPGSRSTNKEVDNAVATEDSAWHSLNGSVFGDFNPSENKWLNLTGFRESDGWAWEGLVKARNRAREQTIHALGEGDGEQYLGGNIPKDATIPFYRNVSGCIRGTWIRSSAGEALKRPTPDLETLLPDKIQREKHHYHRNVSGTTGKIQISFGEKGEADEWDNLHARGVKAKLYIEHGRKLEDSSYVILNGLHLLETGSMILVTQSEKFPGLFALPHFALSDRHFSAYQHRLNRTLKDIIDLQKSHRFHDANPWRSSLDEESIDCEIILYLQQHPISTVFDVSSLEKELRFPTGRTGYSVDSLKISMTLFSPDCGYILESADSAQLPGGAKHLVGEKTEVFFFKARRHLIAFGVALLLQALSIMRQTKDSCTPSTKNRISVTSITIFTIGDGLVLLALFTMTTIADMTFITILAMTYLAGISSIMFDTNFVVGIYLVQLEDDIRMRRQQESQSPNRSSTPQVTHPPVDIDVLPLPVTASRAFTPEAPMASDGEGPMEVPTDEVSTSEASRQMFSRVIFSVVCIFILTFWAMTWGTFMRNAYFNLMAFIYVSCWIPQIYRNAIRNCRKALRWDFVVGQSTLRLLPLMYFYAYDGNLLYLAPERNKAIFFAGWAWTQICILVIQDVFGPRLFVPKSWMPPAYDYHPILREDDENARIILGFSSSPNATSPTTSRPGRIREDGTESRDSKFKRLFDCAICMQSVEVPIIPNSNAPDGKAAEGLTGSAFLWRRNYMITPCRHVFHTKCLEAAMRYRLQCPICREGLPPL